MKKVIFGCLGVAVVLGIAGAFCGYYFVYRPARAYVAEYGKLQEIPKLDAQIRNQRSFSAPDNGELKVADIERFIRAQQSLHTQLGTRVDQLKAKYHALGDTGPERKDVSITEVFNALKDLAGLIVDAKRAQVEALNQNNYSLAEYNWTRSRIYEAAGIPIDMALANALADVASGKKTAERAQADLTAVDVPPKNRELVAPFIPQLKDRAALAFFGL